MMQIVGVAGRSGAGKTTLCHVIARMLVDRPYGLPKLLHFGSDDMEVVLQQLYRDERRGLGDRTEYFVLIDNIRTEDDALLLKRWGAVNVFLCADKRLGGRTWHESERLARDYSSGRLGEQLFDFSMTNNGNVEAFEADAERYMDVFLGGAIWRDDK